MLAAAAAPAPPPPPPAPRGQLTSLSSGGASSYMLDLGLVR
jgi:hypothetical protein